MLIRNCNLFYIFYFLLFSSRNNKINNKHEQDTLYITITLCLLYVSTVSNDYLNLTFLMTNRINTFNKLLVSL